MYVTLSVCTPRKKAFSETSRIYSTRRRETVSILEKRKATECSADHVFGH